MAVRFCCADNAPSGEQQPCKRSASTQERTSTHQNVPAVFVSTGGFSFEPLRTAVKVRPVKVHGGGGVDDGGGMSWGDSVGKDGGRSVGEPSTGGEGMSWGDSVGEDRGLGSSWQKSK